MKEREKNLNNINKNNAYEPVVGANIHSSSIDGKLLCSFSDKLCMQRRYGHYAFCIRHILQDKYAPFKQCQYVARYNGQKCTNAVPLNDDRVYCNSHLVVLGIKPKKDKKKEKQLNKGTPDTLTIDGAKEIKLPPNCAMVSKKFNSNNSDLFISKKNEPIILPSPLINLKKNLTKFSEWLKKNEKTNSNIYTQKDLYRIPLLIYQYRSQNGLEVDKSKTEAEIFDLLNEEIRQLVFAKISLEKELNEMKSPSLDFLRVLKRISISDRVSFSTQKRTCRYHKEHSPCYLKPLPCCGYCETHFKYDKDQLLFAVCSFTPDYTVNTCGKLSLKIDGFPPLCRIHMLGLDTYAQTSKHNNMVPLNSNRHSVPSANKRKNGSLSDFNNTNYKQVNNLSYELREIPSVGRINFSNSSLLDGRSNISQSDPSCLHPQIMINPKHIMPNYPLQLNNEIMEHNSYSILNIQNQSLTPMGSYPNLPVAQMTLYEATAPLLNNNNTYMTESVNNIDPSMYINRGLNSFATYNHNTTNL